jgi:hypothetical protein
MGGILKNYPRVQLFVYTAIYIILIHQVQRGHNGMTLENVILGFREEFAG